jgi:hypothetical protein
LKAEVICSSVRVLEGGGGERLEQSLTPRSSSSILSSSSGAIGVVGGGAADIERMRSSPPVLYTPPYVLQDTSGCPVDQ